MTSTNTLYLALVTSAILTSRGEAALVHFYDFNGNLNDSVGGVPLVNNGGTLGAGSLAFGANQGPTLNAEATLAGTYSIGLEFVLSDVTGWKKVIDYKYQSATDDSGQYILNNTLAFCLVKNYSITTTTPLNSPVRLVVTRDGSTYAAYVNDNPTPVYSFNDSTGKGVAIVLGGQSVFNFFRDDLNTTYIDNGKPYTEASAGTVSQIRVWNTALSASEVSNAFAPVPEPSTYLAGLGALGMLGAFGWRRHK